MHQVALRFDRVASAARRFELHHDAGRRSVHHPDTLDPERCERLLERDDLRSKRLDIAAQDDTATGGFSAALDGPGLRYDLRWEEAGGDEDGGLPYRRRMARLLIFAAVVSFCTTAKAQDPVDAFGRDIQSQDATVRSRALSRGFQLFKTDPARVFAALVRAGEASADSQFSTTALEAARNMTGSEPDWNTIAPDLLTRRFDGDRRLRARASILMSRSSLPPGVLLTALADPVPGYRSLALAALAGAGPDVQTLALGILETETDRVVRDRARTFVANMPSPVAAALPFVERELKSGQPWFGVEYALARLGPAAAPLVVRLADAQLENARSGMGAKVPALDALRYLDPVPAVYRDVALRAVRMGPVDLSMAGIRLLVRIDAPFDDATKQLLKQRFRQILSRNRIGRTRTVDWANEVLHRLGKRGSFLLPELEKKLQNLIGPDPSGTIAIRFLLRSGATSDRLLPGLEAAIGSANDFFVRAELPKLVEALGSDAGKLVPAIRRRMQRSPELGYGLLARAGVEGAGIVLQAIRDGVPGAANEVKEIARLHPRRAWQAGLPQVHLGQVLIGIQESASPPDDLLPGIVELARDADRETMRAAAAALIRFGEKGYAALKKVLADHPEDAPHILLRALQLRPGGDKLIPDTVAWIRKMPADYNRGALIRALGGQGRAGVHALEVLHGGGIEVGEALPSALGSQDPATRHAAARAVISTGAGFEFLPMALRKLCESSNAADRYWGKLASASVELGTSAPVRVDLHALLATGDVALRIRVLKKIRERPKRPNTDFHLAVDCLLDPSPKVRVAALHVLGALGKSAGAARGVIEIEAKSADPAVQAAAQAALAALR